MHFGGQFEHEMHFCEICGKTAQDDQKTLRVSVCRELKQQATDDPNFTSNIITSDETSVYGYDPETKQQSSQWKLPNSPWPEKHVKFAAMSSPC
jgi:secreted PhoX family phosphatase